MMNNLDTILIIWNTVLTLWIFIHSLKFALVQRILNTVTAILVKQSQKSKLDKLYGRD